MTLSVHLRHGFPGFELDVSFDAPPGVTALFGPSGSGKTTVVRAVAGLMKCEQARIILDGKDLTDHPASRRGFGYVFQDARLFPHLNVLKNLRYGGRSNEDAVISVLGLGDLLERAPATLSGGEAQRVSLGRALMSDPQVLLMDEPLSALDQRRKEDVLPYLDALRAVSGIPILYVSHDVSEVTRLAQHIVLLDRGHIVLSGEMDAVLADPASMRFLGPRDGGAVLSGQIVGIADDGLTKVETAAGVLWVPGSLGRPGEQARVRIPAHDVILARSAPTDMSALNVLSVIVEAVETSAEPVVIVQMRAGSAPLLARITTRSAKALALAKGEALYAIVKTTAIASG